MSASAISLERVSERLAAAFAEGRETDANWEPLEGLLRQASGCIGLASEAAVLAFVRRHADLLTGCVQSERTRLASAAMDAVRDALQSLNDSLEWPYWDRLLAALFKVCERANRVHVSRAKACLLAVLPQAPFRMAVGKVCEGLRGSLNRNLRAVVAELLVDLLRTASRRMPAYSDEAESWGSLKRSVGDALGDASASVREAARLAVSALYSARPELARDEAVSNTKRSAASMPNSPRTAAVPSSAVSVASSGASRASSGSVLRAPRIVSSSRLMGSSSTNAVAGPQRILSSSSSATALAAPPQFEHQGTAPKRALRVASTLLTASMANVASSPAVARSSRVASREPSSSTLASPRSRLAASTAAVPSPSLSSSTLAVGPMRSISRLASEWLRKFSASTSSQASAAFQGIEGMAKELQEVEAPNVLPEVLVKLLQCLTSALGFLNQQNTPQAQQAVLGLAACICPLISDAVDARIQTELLKQLLVLAHSSQLLARELVVGRLGWQPAAAVLLKLITASLSPANQQASVIVCSAMSLSLCPAEVFVQASNQSVLGRLLDHGFASTSTKLASLRDSAIECLCRVQRCNADAYYAIFNEHVRSAEAREAIRAAVHSLYSNAPIVDDDGDDVLLPSSEATEDELRVCVTPMRPIRGSEEKTPSRVLTPLQASVKRRIESAVRSALTPSAKARSPTMPDGSAVGEEEDAGVGVLVERVKDRIKAAFSSIASTPKALLPEPSIAALGSRLVASLQSSPASPPHPQSHAVVVERVAEELLSDPSSVAELYQEYLVENSNNSNSSKEEEASPFRTPVRRRTTGGGVKSPLGATMMQVDEEVSVRVIDSLTSQFQQMPSPSQNRGSQ